MDLLGAMVGLIIFSPIFLVISILYMTGDNKGPIFLNRLEWEKTEKDFIFINSDQ